MNHSYARKMRHLKQLATKLQLALNQEEKPKELVRLLVSKIKSLLNELRLAVSGYDLKKAMGAVAVFFGLAVSTNASAQLFTTPVLNPFGLDSVSYYALPAVADLDGDGDLDLLVGEEYGSLQYFQNTGTKTSPMFGAPVQNPFGISVTSAYYVRPVFADMDNDGDQDLILGDFYGGGILYQQNTGTATSPMFAAAVTNPFGITPVAIAQLPTIADLDNDGDLDMLVGEENGNMRYFENTGSKTNPMFAAGVLNPFGLAPTYYFAAPAFGDVDLDGDFDLMVGEYYGAIQYFENTGTKTNPAFGVAQNNPFGIVSTLDAAFPVMADFDDDGDQDLLVGEYYGTMKYFQNLDPTVSLLESPAFAFSLFPSPASEYFSIVTQETIVKIEIISLTGQLVELIEKPKERIDISKLNNGTYLVKLYNASGEASVRKLNKI